MHLVYDVHFIFRFHRCQSDFFPQFSDIVYSPVGSRVNFHNIHRRTGSHGNTHFTFIARFKISFSLCIFASGSLAIYGLRQYPRRTGFPQTPGSGKKPGMRQIAVFKKRFQVFSHVFPHGCQIQFRNLLRSVL